MNDFNVRGRAGGSQGGGAHGVPARRRAVAEEAEGCCGGRGGGGGWLGVATTPDSGVTVSRPSSAPHAAPLSDDGSAPRRLALADVGSAAAAASPRLLPLAVEDDRQRRRAHGRGRQRVPGDAGRGRQRVHTCLWRCRLSSLRAGLGAGEALRLLLLRGAGAAHEESRRERRCRRKRSSPSVRDTASGVSLATLTSAGASWRHISHFFGWRSVAHAFFITSLRSSTDDTSATSEGIAQQITSGSRGCFISRGLFCVVGELCCSCASIRFDLI